MITIDIKGTDYELRLVERLQDEDGEPCSGLQHWGKGLIEIDAGLAPGPMLITIWHEMIHAMLDNGGVKVKDQKEVNIEIVSHGIYPALQNNPWLMTPETLTQMLDEKKT